MSIQLNKPQDYLDLYRDVGCMPYMLDWFNKFNDYGYMGRVLHWSRVYAESLGKNKKFRCQQHEKFHNYIDKESKELRTICPENPTYSGIKPRYYNENFSWKENKIAHPENMEDIEFIVYRSRIIHFFNHLWDKAAITYGISEKPQEEYATAFIPVIDLDSKIGNSVEGRKDFLNDKVFEDFSVYNDYLIEELDKKGLNFWKMSSGNGLYFIIEPFEFDDVEELRKFKQGFADFNDDMRDYLTSLKYVKNDAIKFMGWQSYFKCPFSLHKDFDRFALPLPAKEELDKDYIETLSKPENLNEDIVKEIWEESGFNR
ncbi:MAG: hypothetical protein ACOCRK_07805 [bacterium]